MNYSVYDAYAELFLEASPFHLEGYQIGRLDVDPDLGSIANHNICRQWVKECREHHSGCSKSTMPRLPTRVVDVQSKQLKIIQSAGARGEYAALSHCWGGAKMLTCLTTATLEQYQSELPFELLPANFQDAVTITRELGLQYLWVDTLCILQDSKSDWEYESKHMGPVYRDASLTISAISSKCSTEGILKFSLETSLDPSPVTMSIAIEDGSDVTVRIERRNLHEEDLRELKSRSPLASRGWTLQEEVLSSRILYYGKRQIYWRCGQGYQALDGTPPANRFPELYMELSDVVRSLTNPDASSQLTTQFSRQYILDMYYELVKLYSNRNLTFDSDKLPALSGLSQQLHSALGGDYLAGLWSNDLLNGLCWYYDLGSCKHVQQYRAPSWSWAVTNEAVLFKSTWQTRSTKLELISYEVVHCDKSNPFGEVESASITVTGLTLPVLRSGQVLQQYDLDESVGMGFFDELDKAHTEVMEAVSNITAVFPSKLTVDDEEINCIVTMLHASFGGYSQGLSFNVDIPMISLQEYIAVVVSATEGDDEEQSHMECLILAKSDEILDQDIAVYRRVGLLTLHGYSADWLAHWKSQTMKLI
jgi:hypothetical protein